MRFTTRSWVKSLEFGGTVRRLELIPLLMQHHVTLHDEVSGSVVGMVELHPRSLRCNVLVLAVDILQRYQRYLPNDEL
jgi:hypothetical protein